MTTTDKFASRPNNAAIAIAEDRYRALIRATLSLAWTSAPDGQIVDMPEWRAYTGMSLEQIKSWGWLGSCIRTSPLRLRDYECAFEVSSSSSHPDNRVGDGGRGRRQ